jgi:cell division protein FtsQ
MSTVRQGAPRQRQASSRPWLLWLAAVLAASAYWLLFHTQYFVITQVTVTGATRVEPTTVLTLAAIPTGGPLAQLKTADAVKAISELPQVKSVTVERVWPHSVLITVTERQPVAVARVAEGYVEVDSMGVAASAVMATPPKGQVAIDGTPGTPAMRAAVAVVTGIPDGWKLLTVSAPTQDAVSITLSGGVSIVFGSGDDVARKVAVARALLANKYKRIDVSAPDAPTVRK